MGVGVPGQEGEASSPQPGEGDEADGGDTNIWWGWAGVEGS